MVYFSEETFFDSRRRNEIIFLLIRSRHSLRPLPTSAVGWASFNGVQRLGLNCSTALLEFSQVYEWMLLYFHSTTHLQGTHTQRTSPFSLKCVLCLFISRQILKIYALIAFKLSFLLDGLLEAVTKLLFLFESVSFNARCPTSFPSVAPKPKLPPRSPHC